MQITDLTADIGGGLRSCLAAFDVSTGSLLPWARHLESMGRCLARLTAGDDVVYAGGPFTSGDGTPHPHIAALDTTLHRMLLSSLRS